MEAWPPFLEPPQRDTRAEAALQHIPRLNARQEMQDGLVPAPSQVRATIDALYAGMLAQGEADGPSVQRGSFGGRGASL